MNMANTKQNKERSYSNAEVLPPHTGINFRGAWGNMLAYMKLSGLVLVLLLLTQAAGAKDGRYISPWAGGQYVSINNTSDYFDRYTRLTKTYNWTAGLMYLNQEGILGLQSGVIYSRQGQRYHGTYEVDEVELQYRSALNFQYLKVPFEFTFSSGFNEAENLNIYVFAGLQLGILLAIDMETQPEIQNNSGSRPDLSDLFNTFDPAFTSGATINYWPDEQRNFYLGIRMDRSLRNIENTQYEFDEDVPYEYHFPVSTKKTDRPDVRRMESRNLVFTLQVGVRFRISES